VINGHFSMIADRCAMLNHLFFPLLKRKSSFDGTARWEKFQISPENALAIRSSVL